MCTIIYPQKYPYSSNFYSFIFLTFNPESRQISHIFSRCRPRTRRRAHKKKKMKPSEKGFVLPSFSHCEPGECLLVNYKEKRFKQTLPEKYNFFYQMKFNTKFFIKFILARRIPSSYSLVLRFCTTLSREQYLECIHSVSSSWNIVRELVYNFFFCYSFLAATKWTRTWEMFDNYCHSFHLASQLSLLANLILSFFSINNEMSSAIVSFTITLKIFRS